MTTNDNTIQQIRLKILDAEKPGYDPAFNDLELEAFINGSDGNIPIAAGNALTEMVDDPERLNRWSRGDASVDYEKLKKDILEVAQKFHNQGIADTDDTDDS